MTVSAAESCTGGKIAQLLTSIPGSSAYFKGGVVSYATEVKTEILKVPQELIEKYSVVSREVAIEMALGAQKLLQTDYAIATTGNAGPEKGDSPAEVGTVFIALATPNPAPNNIICEEFHFGQPREKVIDRAVNTAFEMLQKEILKNLL